jgi:hypothetical protein
MEARSCHHCCCGKSNKYYIFWVCVCSLSYTVCSAHAPYCHLWPAPLFKVCPHYLITVTISIKKLLNVKCVFLFSLQLTSEIFFILKRTEIDDKKYVLVRMQIFRYSCPFLMNLEVYRQIFEKYANMKFHDNPSSGSRVVPCGRTDRQTACKKCRLM